MRSIICVVRFNSASIGILAHDLKIGRSNRGRYLVCQLATKLFQPAFQPLDRYHGYNAVFLQPNIQPIFAGPHHVKP